MSVVKRRVSLLASECHRLGQSLARAVQLPIGGKQARSNGLAQFAGGWTDQELAAFEAATLPFEQVDEDLWR